MPRIRGEGELGPPLAAPTVIVREDKATGNGVSWDAEGLLPVGFGPVKQSHVTAAQATQK